MKRLMLAAMKAPAPDLPPKRPEVNSAAFLSTLGLEQFFTKNTKRLFSTLGQRAYRPSSKLLFQVLEWSSYLVFHPELLRPKLLPSSCLWRNGVLRIVLRRCFSTLQSQILAVILVLEQL